MTTSEQDIEMYMRVYAAVVGGIMSAMVKDIPLEALREQADNVARDAVEALRGARE